MKTTTATKRTDLSDVLPRLVEGSVNGLEAVASAQRLAAHTSSLLTLLEAVRVASAIGDTNMEQRCLAHAGRISMLIDRITRAEMT